MSEEISLDGIGVAPGVLETIATVAARGVEGVADICGGQAGLAGLVQRGPATRGMCVEIDASNDLVVSVHVSVHYGRPLREVAAEVQRAVTDALLTHTGQAVAAVDVYVDSVVFPEQ
jgi:uncharacterized alkaline shock family protein YloU